MRGAEARHAFENSASGLEQTPDERAVDLGVIGLQDGRRDARYPALAAVILVRQGLRESRGLPPAGQPDRLERELVVALLLGNHGLDAEEVLSQNAEARHYIQVSVRDAEPDA